MGFWNLLAVASAPITQVLLITALGAFMATEYFNNLLSTDFQKSLNKVVFIVFTPSLIFTSISSGVSLEDLISWWFMPVNMGLTYLIGWILGWIIVKLLKPNLKVECLIIALCSSGNMGYLLLVIIPAICDEKGGPFGGGDACHNKALSYSSFSFALSGVFFWTYTYRMMQKRSIRYKELEIDDIFKVPNRDLDTNAETHLLSGKHDRNQPIEVSSSIYIRDNENQIILDQGSSSVSTKLEESFWDRMVETSRNVAGLMTPPAIATLLGFLFGMVKWLRNLIIGDNAPLRVVTDSVHILGSGTTSCITILLGASLTQGMQSSSVKPLTLFCILIARPFLLPAIGLFVVKAAAKFGLIPVDPLFQYVLVMQYAMPPAMNISTMVQLFDIGVEESSVMLLWSYGIAPISLTAWSTLLLWLFS